MSKRMDADYWNNRFPRAPIVYAGRALRGASDRIGVDVKTFIKEGDELICQAIDRYNLRDRSKDKTVENVQKFVVDTFTYKYDSESSNVPEFWQFPFESLQSGIGDCEDGAILIAALLVNAGVPSWRVKVAAGYVQAKPTAPQGGHAYCIYLADDGEWRNIDWCYYEDSNVPIRKKPLSKNGGQRNAYKDIWFTFNDKFSWNQSSIEIREGRISEHQTKALNETFIDNAITVESIMTRIDERLEENNEEFEGSDQER